MATIGDELVTTNKLTFFNFNKKSLNYDYEFYYELKTGRINCEFGNCNTSHNDIEIIKSEYEKIKDDNRN